MNNIAVLLNIIPKKECLCTRYCDKKDNLTHVLTFDKNTEYYKMYSYQDNKLKLLGKNKNSPLELEQKILTNKKSEG